MVELDKLVMGLVVAFVVIGMLLVPVAIKSFNQGDDVKSHLTIATYGSNKTTVAPNTEIDTTNISYNTDVEFTLYVRNVAKGTYTQNQYTNTKYSIDGFGDLYINATDVGVSEWTCDAQYDDLYGSNTTTRTIWDNIVPISLVVILLVLIFQVKRP